MMRWLVYCVGTVAAAAAASIEAKNDSSSLYCAPMPMHAAVVRPLLVAAGMDEENEEKYP